MTNKCASHGEARRATVLPSQQRLDRGAALILGMLVACGPTGLDGDATERGDETADLDGGYTEKITQGTKTTAYPSVGYFTSGGTSCTATLIGPRDVLTAAHCINSSSGGFWIGGSTRRWSKAYMHESYDDDTLDNDIAVATLDSAVNGITPSPLGTAALSRGQKITLLGYGYTSFSGGNSAGDKYVGTNTIADLGSSWFSYEGNSNNCSGDSGGPTFIGQAVVGVHSSGVGNQYCSTTGYDVRVDRYVSWIKSKAMGAGTGTPPPPTGTCTDTSGFVDAQGYKCSAWVGYNCANAVEQYGYTQAQETSLLAGCRATCGQCSGGGDPGTGSGELAKWKAYFGYLHSHTGTSDGEGTPSQAFKSARSAGLDFFAVTEHDYYPDAMTSSDWSNIQAAADANYSPGSFVTFRGFEWTSDTSAYQTNGLGLGHMTIINSKDYCSSASSSTRTLNQVVTWLGGQDAVAFLNHPGQYGTTFDRFNFNKSDKIVGMELWNRSEDYYSKSGFYGQGYYDEALSRGWYFGAGGGQDNHDTDWGSMNEWRIGVLGTELTRASILSAFRARRFYSVRDRNLAVSFSCNGAQMGSRIARGSVKCEIQTRDGDSERTTRIDLLRRGTVIQTWSPNSATPLVSTTVTTTSGDYLYARIYQGSSWTAITSPIFFN